MTGNYSWFRNRRGFLKFASAWAGWLMLPKFSRAEDSCEVTPSTEDGPLYPATEIPWASDLTRVPRKEGVANGQIAYLYGQVKNADCRPVSDATVEIWQADNKGYYKHPRHNAPDGLDPNFRYFGKVRADENGRYAIKTIVPKWYRIFDIDRAAHVHMKVRSPANGVFTSEVYFSGEDQEALRDDDPVFQSRRNKEQLVVRVEQGADVSEFDLPSEVGAFYCKFDVMYRI